MEKPINVIQLFETYPLFYQPYIPPVVKMLQEQEGLDVAVYAFEGESNLLENAHVIAPNFKKKLTYKWYAYRYSKYPKLSYIAYHSIAKNVSILHVQHSYLIGKIAALLDVPVKERPKVILTLRGGDSYIKPWVRKKWKDFYKKYGNKVDAIITMSEHQKDYLKKWGVVGHNVHVIPISFGHRFDALPKQVDKDSIKIMSVFRMTWEKNIDGNLRVIKALKERGLPVQFKLFGSGPSAGQVYYLVDKYQLTDCVEFAGDVDNGEVKKQLKNSDFLLQLSLSEAFPTTVIEAQSFGLPALVSNNGGLPESIIDGESGYCLDADAIEEVADKIVSLWKSPEMYTKFSAAAITNSQSNYSVTNEVSRLSSLYHKLLARA